MPDDSDPNFKAEQSRHAADARIIREVSRHSNVPANQIRQAMRNGSLVTGQQNIQVAGQIPRPDLRPPAPLDVSRTRNFDPRPFKPEPAVFPVIQQLQGSADSDGTSDNPYLMSLGHDPATDPATDTWDRETPPDGFDGVIIQVLVRKPDGFFHRRMTFNSNGRLVHISAEEAE